MFYISQINFNTIITIILFISFVIVCNEVFTDIYFLDKRDIQIKTLLANQQSSRNLRILIAKTMCPPNQVPQGYSEEDNDLFSLDFASICDPTFFATLTHGLPACELPRNPNDPSYSPIGAESNSNNEDTSSPTTPSGVNVDERSYDDGRNNKPIEELEDIKTGAIVEDYWRQQKECTKAFVLGQSSLLEDAMYQNGIKATEDISSNGSITSENENKNQLLECTTMAFLQTKDFSNKQTEEIESKRKMVLDSEVPKPEIHHSTDSDDGDEEFESKRRRLICKVCGDTASGFHYRVASCEACKAFFKRTVQGKIDYACPASGNCKISTRGRKACQACRFVKCTQAGMLKEGVRTDRKRGGRQKYFRRAINSSQSTMYPIQINGMSLEDNILLHSLKNCSLSSTRIAMSLLKIETMNPAQIWIVLAELFNRCIQDVIGGLNEVIGFLDFSMDNKISILKKSWSEVLTLKFVCLSAEFEVGFDLKFAPNFSLAKSKAIECGMEDYFDLVLKAANRVSSLGGMHSEEILILQALILVNADNNLGVNKQHEELKDTLLSLLTKKSLALSPSSPSSAVLHVQNLLLLLPCIKEANMVMQEMWKELERQIDPSNKLLIEMICR